MLRKFKLGVIALPNLYGPSQSFSAYVGALPDLVGGSCQVATVPLYGEGEKPPFFLRYVIGRHAAKLRDILGASIDSDALTGRITDAATALTDDNCTKIALLGFGYGGLAAIRAAAAMNAASADAVSGLVAWYPTLFNDAETPTTNGATILGLGNIRCPAFMFYGDADDQSVESLALVKAASERRGSDIKFRIYPGAHQAFAERHIQGRWPNPRYHREYGPESLRDAAFWLRRPMYASA